MDDFFAFCRERESIRIKRAAGQAPPWTDDPILQTYRFTNINRDHDYGTVRMKQVIQQSAACRASYESVIHFVMIYRLLGSPRWIIEDGNVCDDIMKVLVQRIRDGQTIMRMSAYQINVPKGMSAITMCCDSRLVTVAQSIPQLWNAMPAGTPTGMLSIRAIIASGIHEMGYNYTWFHGMEIAKDLALLFPAMVDRQSMVALGPGAIMGLRRIGHGDSVDIIDVQNESVDRDDVTPLSLSNTEHALCEYNKYCEAKFEGKDSRRYMPHDE